jgi:hypothetical protein
MAHACFETMTSQLSLKADMSTSTLEKNIETKMTAAGVAAPTITAFLGALRRVIAGERGMVPETEVDAISSLPRLDDISEPASESEHLLKKLVVVNSMADLEREWAWKARSRFCR